MSQCCFKFLNITSCFFETLREAIEHFDAEGVSSRLIEIDLLNIGGG
jgi:hypothetical protein